MILKANPNYKNKEYDDVRQAEREGPLGYPSPGKKPKLGQNYFEYFIPALPIWTNKELNYKDRYGNDAKVNLFKVTCTCQDYDDRKSVYKDRDIRRCCKHIYYKFANTRASQCVKPLTLMFIHSSAIFNEELLYKYNVKEKDVYLGFNRRTDWVNVYALNNWEKGFYVRYSYNPITKKWSYGTLPTYSHFIEHYIFTNMQYQLPYEHKYVQIQKILAR